MGTTAVRARLPIATAAALVACTVITPSAAQQAPAAPQPRPAAPRGSAASPQFPAGYKGPRLGGHPDLNGMWQAFVTANIDLQDHEAQAGPHTELMGAYGGGPRASPTSQAAKNPTSPTRSRGRRRTPPTGPRST
jgi:hypothetical protein